MIEQARAQISCLVEFRVVQMELVDTDARELGKRDTEWTRQEAVLVGTISLQEREEGGADISPEC